MTSEDWKGWPVPPDEDEDEKLKMCAQCQRVEGCMERWDTPQFKAQQERCQQANSPGVCSKCGALREETTPINGLGWARRHGKQYCPKCYHTLPPIIVFKPKDKEPQSQSSKSNEEKENGKNQHKEKAKPKRKR